MLRMIQRQPIFAAVLAALFLAAASVALADRRYTNVASGQRAAYTIFASDQRVGFASRATESLPDGGSVTTHEWRMLIAQLRRQTPVGARLQVERAADGSLRAMSYQSSFGVDTSRWSGVAANNRRSIDITVGDQRRVYRLPQGVGTIWPDELPRRVARLPASAAPTLFLTFDPAQARTTTLLVTPGTPAALAFATPSGPRDESWWLEDDGTLQRLERRLFGAKTVWERCYEQCDTPIERPLDLIERLVVRSPFRIPDGALQGPIRYILVRDTSAGAALPSTGEQAVLVDGPRVIVTICENCGSTGVLTAADRGRFLAANRWVDSDHRSVKLFALKAAGGIHAPDAIMQRLTTAVAKHMTGAVDYLGYASASEALASRAGDCTEFAVLLAAAGRARGVPTRVVFGWVYSDRFSGKRDVFSPHAWVQAWTGSRWVSYDAGLSKFDATHVALAIGDGDPRKSGSLVDAAAGWRIEKLGLVRDANVSR
jgi:hypothetical protein